MYLKKHIYPMKDSEILDLMKQGYTLHYTPPPYISSLHIPQGAHYRNIANHQIKRLLRKGVIRKIRGDMRSTSENRAEFSPV